MQPGHLSLSSRSLLPVVLFLILLIHQLGLRASAPPSLSSFPFSKALSHSEGGTEKLVKTLFAISYYNGVGWSGVGDRGATKGEECLPSFDL